MNQINKRLAQMSRSPSSQPRKIYIIAFGHRDFVRYCYSHNLSPHETQYIPILPDSSQALAGLSDVTIVFTEGAHLRPDYHRLYQYIDFYTERYHFQILME